MNVSTGSHHEGERAHPEIELDKRLIRRAWAIRDDDLGGRGVVPMPLAAGEMSVHHALMVHASAANESDETPYRCWYHVYPATRTPTRCDALERDVSAGQTIRFTITSRSSVSKRVKNLPQQRVAYHREMVARYQGRQEARVAG